MPLSRRVRWQVSWLTGLGSVRLISRFRPMAFWTSLAVYSCGGSHGFGP